MSDIRVLDLFSGIGGFSLGLKRAGGFRTVCYVEIDKRCRAVLSRWLPGRIETDIRAFSTWQGWPFTEDIHAVVGGDPCPSRSLAKGNRKSKHPDLAGYFLAVVARLGPKWVVRENVPSPDAIDFAASLEALGYGVTAFALDARDFTAQSRRRQFIVGCPREVTTRFRRALLDSANGTGFSSSGQQEETPIAACLTAHPARMAAEDSYCWEPGKGLRVLVPEEGESLQGFPRGWTSGFSRSRRRIMLGNAVAVPCVEWIGRRIKDVS